ncbi:hypothetical protein N8E89_09325 [Phyllobacterium sp. A18/5-2]|uniref:hypothetical protein n=1 Tax=Phyllobacterium sp. A18/5-2 TaxID=2978392 RepID=UPI0021C79970|nr:hypothetical protein [Phyllobacterium sp. A18/5-2]UXN62916.1 hypothetical protein N8E89_09325 [Phyllobacterium sp. A18/5-2]
MVNRILLGNHPTFGMGGYVSIPGVDVFSANKFQFSWSTIYEQFQILQSGSVSVSYDAPAVGFSWSNLGYYPIIFLSNDKFILQLQYLSTASAQVDVSNIAGDASSDQPSGSATVYYIVTRSILP